jgi:uncharacterized membrane protein YkvA (DUF1232 family)
MENKDFYQKLRKRLNAWAAGAGKDNKALEYILLAPDFFHLLCKILLDPRVPSREKAKVGGAIAYFMSPLDVVPEGLFGPAGYVDDVALAAFVLNSVLESAGPEVLREHWAGNGDVLDQIRSVIKVADQLLGSGAWKKIKHLLKRE